MSKAISGIYIIANTKNGNFYIGQSVNMQSRWDSHKAALNKGVHKNSHLQRAWNKYGKVMFGFLVLEYCSIEALDAREQHYLDLYASNDNCYNVAKDVQGPQRGRTLSDEHKRKISDTRKANKAKSKMPPARAISISGGREYVRIVNLAAKLNGMTTAEFVRTAIFAVYGEEIQATLKLLSIRND